MRAQRRAHRRGPRARRRARRARLAPPRRRCARCSSLMPNLPKEIAGDPRQRARERRARRPRRVEPHARAGHGRRQAEDPRDVRREGARAPRPLDGAASARGPPRVARGRARWSRTKARSQREQILRQQMKNIREELGEAGEDDEIEELRERIRRARLSEDAQKIAQKQLSRLAGMQQQSAEFNVTRTYLEWLADLPWSKTTHDKLDPTDVRRCLDEDHFGLDKVKKRIVEYIAVRKLARRTRRGRSSASSARPASARRRSAARSRARWGAATTASRSAACATRPRSAVTAARTSARSRAASSRASRRSASKNPVFVLDEIDKMGVDMMGDPVRGAPRGARPRAEQHVPGSLHRHAVRSLAGHVPRDREQPGHDPRAALGPPRGHRGARLHAPREAQHRQGVPRARSSSRRTASPTSASTSRHDGIETIIDRYTREAGVRGLEREIGSRLPRDRDAPRRGRGRPRARHAGARREGPRPAAPHPGPRRAHDARPASPPASRGRRAAATSSSSRRRACPARATSSSPAT